MQSQKLELGLYYIKQNTPFAFMVITTNNAGTPQPNPIKMHTKLKVETDSSIICIVIYQNERERIRVQFDPTWIHLFKNFNKKETKLSLRRPNNQHSFQKYEHTPQCPKKKKNGNSIFSQNVCKYVFHLLQSLLSCEICFRLVVPTAAYNKLTI